MRSFRIKKIRPGPEGLFQVHADGGAIHPIGIHGLAVQDEDVGLAGFGQDCPILYEAVERFFGKGFGEIMPVIKETHLCPVHITKRQISQLLEALGFRLLEDPAGISSPRNTHLGSGRGNIEDRGWRNLLSMKTDRQNPCQRQEKNSTPHLFSIPAYPRDV
jgi:hypothetical protein